ncbi:MAG: glycosyltransferase [Desulfuromonadales bacterium]|nr:glycosyltransferase [Desulfuromonadales bacterium]
MIAPLINRRLLSFVTSTNDAQTLHQRLLASPCLANGGYDLAIYLEATSAAAAFNPEMQRRPAARWLVWVHQDVFLPEGWDSRFLEAIADTEKRLPDLAVVGLYGMVSSGEGGRRAGHLLDRGVVLHGEEPLPCRAESLDELLFAVRTDTGLLLDPVLGFDFYGTDLALTARQAGYDVAVVDAYCEHWSPTPSQRLPPATYERIVASADFFEKKWEHSLPVHTPCCVIREPGDVRRMLNDLMGG